MLSPLLYNIPLLQHHELQSQDAIRPHQRTGCFWTRVARWRQLSSESSVTSAPPLVSAISHQPLRDVASYHAFIIAHPSSHRGSEVQSCEAINTLNIQYPCFCGIFGRWTKVFGPPFQGLTTSSILLTSTLYGGDSTAINTAWRHCHERYNPGPIATCL